MTQEYWAVLLAGAAAMRVFGFFKRSRRDEVPEWAQFFSGSEYEAFMTRLRKFWTDRGLVARIEEGIVRIEGESDWPGELGLTNLAQKCHTVPRERWDEMIAGHFNSLAQTQREHRDLEAQMKDFERVREMLAVRIATYDFERGMVVSREDIPGTISYLCIDLPSSVISLHPNTAEEWGVPVDELFAIGLENVRRTCVPHIGRGEFEPGVPYYLLAGESFFVATHALMLRRWQGCEGKHGALVAIPHRHAVLCHPINDMRHALAVQRMYHAAQNMEKEGPGSITANLYWYHDGRYTLLPCELRGKDVLFTPPDEFVEMMNQLATEEE
jgi:hypothetical protein